MTQPPLDLSLIDQIDALDPDLFVRWWTKRSGQGWIAHCQAGYRDYIAPIWAGEGETEQGALDRAAGHALHYWREFKLRREV